MIHDLVKNEDHHVVQDAYQDPFLRFKNNIFSSFNIFHHIKNILQIYCFYLLIIIYHVQKFVQEVI